MKGLKPACILCFLLFCCRYGYAQQGFLNRSAIGGQFHYGSFLTVEPKAVYLKDSYSYFGELYFQQSTKYPAECNKAAPQWGAGLFFGQTGSKQYVGKMGGLFSFISLPLFKYKTFTSNLRLGAGLGWIEKPYDKITNHKNVLIGSPINGYINAFWQNEWGIAPNTFLNAGVSFSHLSNGSSSLPNLGLNIPAVSAGVRYGGTLSPKELQTMLNPAAKKWAINAYTSLGIKQKPWVGSKRYIINVVSTEISKRVSVRSQFGVGAFLFYDRSLVIDPQSFTGAKRDVSKVQAGAYIAYDYKVGRLSLPLQLGIPIINSKTNAKRFQQIGIRYSLTERWTSQLLLKTYGGKADLLHLGIGYKIF